MAPKRSSSLSSTSKSASTTAKKNKKASSLQQSTLSFSRGKAATTGPSSSKSTKGKGKRASVTPVAVDLSSSSDEDDDDLPLEISSQEEQQADVQVEEAAPEVKVVVKELRPQGSEWDSGYIQAKKMMGSVEPIHADDHSKVDTILRIFDLDFRFGPCTSISRLDRWNRAERLGLEPPAHIKAILTTRQGSSETRLRENVLYGAI